MEKQKTVIKEYTMKVDGNDFTKRYLCKSESEVLDAEIDYYTKLLLLTDGYVLKDDKKRKV